jgi:hypothetical protein
LLAAWFLEAETHASHLSERAIGAGCLRSPRPRRVT